MWKLVILLCYKLNINVVASNELLIFNQAFMVFKLRYIAVYP